MDRRSFNPAIQVRIPDYISKQTQKIDFDTRSTKYTSQFSTHSDKKAWSSGPSSKIKSNFDD